MDMVRLAEDFNAEAIALERLSGEGIVKFSLGIEKVFGDVVINFQWWVRSSRCSSVRDRMIGIENGVLFLRLALVFLGEVQEHYNSISVCEYYRQG